MRSSSHFDDAVREYGGELSREMLPTPARRLLDRVVGYVDSLRRVPDHFAFADLVRRTRFGVVDNRGFNAVAGLRGDCFYIGIFGGLLFRLYDTFYKIFAHPGVFPVLGDPSRSGELPDVSLRVLDCDGRVDSEYLTKSLFQVLPTDQSRAQFAIELADFALQFVYHHELGHIMGGHISYLMNLTGSADNLEFGDFQSRGLPALIARALECDADCGAGYLWTFWVAQMIRHRPDCALTTLDPDLMFLLWAFAIDALFRIMDVAGLDTDLGDVHPHPDTRFKFFSVGAITYLQESESDLVDPAMRGFAAAPGTTDKVWQIMGWQTAPNRRLDQRPEEDEIWPILDEILPLTRLWRS